eukprot:UN04860
MCGANRGTDYTLGIITYGHASLLVCFNIRGVMLSSVLPKLNDGVPNGFVVDVVVSGVGKPNGFLSLVVGVKENGLLFLLSLFILLFSGSLKGIDGVDGLPNVPNPLLKPNSDLSSCV